MLPRYAKGQKPLTNVVKTQLYQGFSAHQSDPIFAVSRTGAIAGLSAIESVKSLCVKGLALFSFALKPKGESKGESMWLGV